jgi:hypothetical protein
VQNATDPSAAYSNIISLNLQLFVQALQLYAGLGGKAISNSLLSQSPKIQTGFRNIMQTIEICGESLTCLPTPPPGAEQADPIFRLLGREILATAGMLKQLMDQKDLHQREHLLMAFQDQLSQVNTSFHAAAGAYIQFLSPCIQQ